MLNSIERYFVSAIRSTFLLAPLSIGLLACGNSSTGSSDTTSAPSPSPAPVQVQFDHSAAIKEVTDFSNPIKIGFGLGDGSDQGTAEIDSQFNRPACLPLSVHGKEVVRFQPAKNYRSQLRAGPWSKSNPTYSQLMQSFDLVGLSYLQKSRAADPYINEMGIYATRVASAENSLTFTISKKITAGEWFVDDLDRLDSSKCGKNVVSKIKIGAALSLSMIIKFANKQDLTAFTTQFGNASPLAADSDPSFDSDITQYLVSHQGRILIYAAQLGGLPKVTKEILNASQCSPRRLSECRELGKHAVNSFTHHQLQAPEVYVKTGGYKIIGFESVAL